MNRINAFSLQCGQKILGGADGNALVSPLSIYYAFAMLAAGADPGRAQDRLLDFLHAKSEEELEEVSLPLLESIVGVSERWEKAGGAPALSLNNSIWVSNRYEVSEEYIARLSRTYHAEIGRTDFCEAEAGKEISRWVEESTNHLISPDLDFDPMTILTIINTLYFRDEWLHPFDSYQTRQGKFHLKNGKRVSAEFMKTKMWGHYASLESCKAVSLMLSYFSEMRFILPEEGVDVSDLLASIEKYEEAMTTTRDRHADIALKLPKFEFQTHTDVCTKAGRLGIDQTLQELTFNRISKDIPRIDSIIHDAKIKVDENGVEGAAMTEIDIAMGGLPEIPEEKITLTFDRPFLFGIFDSRLDAWLFLGVCSDPTKR